MSATPFGFVNSPISAIPILVGLIAGVWICLELLAERFGIDLASYFPYITTSHTSNGPLVMLVIITVLAGLRGQKIRDIRQERADNEKPKFGPFGLLEKFCLAGVLLGLVTELLV